MNKIVVIGILCFCFVGGLFLTGQTPEVQEEEIYSGPIPLNCDEDYFRKTGITKPLENLDG